MITELFYSHIVNMNRSSLHTKSFRRIHLSVFRYRLVKNGFPGLKSFRGFRETDPWYRRFGIGILASYALMTMDINIVCRFDSSHSYASDKSRIRMESPHSLPKFFQLVWTKPNHCNCLFLLLFFFLLHIVCRPFPASCIVWLIKTNKNILRRRFVWYGFSRLINFLVKLKTKW